MISSKQDRVGARTVQDLERKINLTKVREDIEAKTKLVIESGLQQAGGDIISYINASADMISLKGERLEVDSPNFKLSPDGVIEAKAGIIGGCRIVGEDLKIGNANIGEKLTADNIDATNLTIANTKGDYKVEINEGNIYFKAPQHIYRAEDVQTGLEETYTETPIMRAYILGNYYWLCIKSKIDMQVVGDNYIVNNIIPIGLIITRKLHDGSQEM